MSEPTVLPIHGFVEGDCLGVLVLADPRKSVAVLAQQLLDASAPRVAPPHAVDLIHDGRRLEHARTLLECGLVPLCRVDVVTQGSSHGL